MDDNALDDDLGHAAAEVTPEQREKMLEISDIAERIFPGSDQMDDREQMLSAAVECILGDSDPAQIVDEWKAATKAVWAATVRMRGAVAVEVSRSNELAVSEKFGIGRPTVRKAVGK